MGLAQEMVLHDKGILSSSTTSCLWRRTSDDKHNRGEIPIQPKCGAKAAMQQHENKRIPRAARNTPYYSDNICPSSPYLLERRRGKKTSHDRMTRMISI